MTEQQYYQMVNELTAYFFLFMLTSLSITIIVWVVHCLGIFVYLSIVKTPKEPK